MNPIIEKVARSKPRSTERLVEDVGLIMAASSMAAEDFFAANPDGIFHDHSKYARNIIRATLRHYAENVSSEMELAGLKAGNYANDGETMKSEFRAMIMQALAEVDA